MRIVPLCDRNSLEREGFSWSSLLVQNEYESWSKKRDAVLGGWRFLSKRSFLFGCI